jgi:hypothetical protein
MRVDRKKPCSRPVVMAALADLHQELEPYDSDIGRPSVDPESS